MLKGLRQMPPTLALNTSLPLNRLQVTSGALETNDVIHQLSRHTDRTIGVLGEFQPNMGINVEGASRLGYTKLFTQADKAMPEIALSNDHPP